MNNSVGTSAKNAAQSRDVLFHVFSTLNVGGPQVRLAAIANNYPTESKHLLFAMDHGYDSTKLLTPQAHCEVHDIGYEGLGPIRKVLAFRRELKRLRPDLLITYNWGAIEWALANFGRSLPHIHIVDGFGPEEADGQLPRRVLFRRLVLTRNTTVVVPSQTLFKIATEVWRIDADKVSYIPNGIDCDRFRFTRDDALAKQYGIEPDDIVIGTVATLRPVKNIERLLLAFQKMPKDLKARLIIVGDGSARADLEAFAKELSDVSDRITFTGYFADPAPILTLFDVFALSSDTEQMPISVLEAMASRLPVAAVDVGDVHHIVSDANKPYIVERDVERLSAVMTEFTRDGDLRRRIGDENNRHVREIYDEKTMIDAYARLFSR